MHFPVFALIRQGIICDGSPISVPHIKRTHFSEVSLVFLVEETLLYMSWALKNHRGRLRDIKVNKSYQS